MHSTLTLQQILLNLPFNHPRHLISLKLTQIQLVHHLTSHQLRRISPYIIAKGHNSRLTRGVEQKRDINIPRLLSNLIIYREFLRSSEQHWGKFLIFKLNRHVIQLLLYIITEKLMGE